MEEHRSDRQLAERGVIDILSETFVIYWRHFVKFVVLVAVIQVPIGILELLLALVAPNSDWAFVSLGVIDVMASMVVYAAAIFAVGQHYLIDDVSVERCYVRALWRVVSVVISTVIVGVLFGILMWQLTSIAEFTEGAETIEPEVAMSVLIGTGVVILAGVALLVYSIYLVIIMPAIIVEGHRSQAALRRSSELLKGNKMRVLGHLLVYSLVVIGLLIVLSIPSFVLGAATLSGDAQTFSTSAIGIILSRIVSILIAPITFIATTLLYYDLRIRKENYDIPRLSQEMGVART